jgi:hypothetical protein
MLEKFYITKHMGWNQPDAMLRVKGGALEDFKHDLFGHLDRKFVLEGFCDVCGEPYTIKHTCVNFKNLCYEPDRGDCMLKFVLPCMHELELTGGEAKQVYDYFSVYTWHEFGWGSDNFSMKIHLDVDYWPWLEEEYNKMEFERFKHEFALYNNKSEYGFNLFYAKMMEPAMRAEAERQKRLEQEDYDYDDYD